MELKKIISNYSIAMIAALCSSASAQQIKLKIADSLPPGHYIGKTLPQLFDEVSKATNGAVIYEYYPAQQLGKAKDMLALTLSGVTDIGYTAPSYIPDKLQLGAVGELPGVFSTSCSGTEAYWKLAQPGGLIDEYEFKPNGVRLIYAILLPAYQLFSTFNTASGLGSFEGKKLRPTSGAVRLVRALRATPVQMAAPEIREALTRGTIDGLLGPAQSLFAYGIDSIAKYGTSNGSFGSFVGQYTMSIKRWNSLPANVQAAITEKSSAAMLRNCAEIDKANDGEIEKLKKTGVKFNIFSTEDLSLMARLSEENAQEWAKDLDNRGKRGSEVLKAFIAAVKK